MGLYAPQFRKLVVVPTLNEIDPEIIYSGVAQRLVLETIFHESNCFTYLAQLPFDGPARGLAQIEEPTFNWLVYGVLPKNPKLSLKFLKITANYPNIPFNEVTWNLKLSVALCRLRYYVVPAALPDDTIEGRAAYWSKYYQTSNDPIKTKKFIEHSKQLEQLLN